MRVTTVQESSGSQTPDTLQRILGVAFGIAAALGCTIGVGILRAPGIVAARLDQPGWIITAWICGGVLALLGTLCVIELGTSVPQAGGWYAYTRKAFGDFPAFIVGWSFWLALVSAVSYASTALGEYLSSLVPALAGRDQWVANVALVGFWLFQLTGLKPVSRFEEITGFLKGIVFLGIGVACFIFAPASLSESTTVRPEPTEGMLALPLMFIFALQSVVKTYDGWQAPCYFTEEDINPSRNLPRSMITGTSLIILIYVFLNLAILSILTVPEIAASQLPVATACTKLFGPVTGKIITSIAVLSLMGLLNTLFLSAPRVLFAMARDAMFFHSASEVNRQGIPVLALTVSGGVAFVFMNMSDSFERIFAMSAVLTVVCYAAGYSSLFVLRRKYPNLPRPFKTWGYPGCRQSH